ncbi:phosphatidylserine decarboxylase [Streptomyces hainanensis]|uniref:Phosphatidylserine decarboxylase n=1 Tax=Streptomyces hainanensis TaxID=402648 RepID=A0A4R4TDB1_9ACTN|nr:phosphatidylserine decarboxylase [Streptomyces hainanensis]TDC75518.1 phosphatidylserine decarboxylase [Streptomyces hainanensis]
MADDPQKALEDFLKKIQEWYAADYRGFATLFDTAIANVVPYPEGTKPEVRQDWRGKKIKDLCDFFREWYEWDWKAKPNEGLYYIEKFSWINYENDYGMVFVTCGAGREMMYEFTKVQGLQADYPGTEGQQLIDIWKAELGSRMDDFSTGPWATFNDFFVRDLKDDKRRPIDAEDDNSVVVAPTDCVINMIVDELTAETPIPVKTVTMNVKQLLADSEYHRKFIPSKDENGDPVPGGTAVSCILLPDTYHWYHSPVAGEVVEAHDDIGGVLYGMRDFPGLLNKGNVGYGFDYEMFDDFRRGYVIFRTTFKDPLGKEHETFVGMVTVGLNSIGSVNFLPEFRNPKKPVQVTKGQKVGNFKYGGSLNILLFEYGRFPALQVYMGQRIGTLEKRDRTEKLFVHPHHSQARRRLFTAP